MHMFFAVLLLALSGSVLAREGITTDLKLYTTQPQGNPAKCPT